MNVSTRRRSGCLKVVLAGCGGLTLLVIVGVVAVLGIARLEVRSEQVEDQVLEYEWGPGEAGSPAAVVATGDAALAGGGGSAARVRLDLAHANFEIEAARSGEPLRVEARYDVDSFELREVRSDPGSGERDVEIRFRRTGSGWFAGLKELIGGSRPKVRIYLPPDSPLHLDLKLSQGGTQADLGGLWLESADIQFEQGGLDLNFGTPLKAPMESLLIDGAMGGMSVSHVGNASPRSLDVRCSMGGMQLDLRGPWHNDSHIRVDARMGGAAVRLPRDVRIEGLASGRIEVGETELEPPVLRFETSASMGEIKVLN